MLEYFRIFASSVPIAVMFIAFCGLIVALTLIRWFKKSDIEDKAYRASQARDVTNRQ